MAAITGVITAVAGLGLTAYQLYESSEAQKDAESAASRAAGQLKSIKEVNAYSSVQAPDLTRLAFEQEARSQAMTTEALSGLGAEGAGQISRVDEISRANALQLAESQAGINYERDIQEAQAGADIEMRKAQRETGIYGAELQGAQTAAAEAKANKQAAAVGLVQGAGNLATSLGDATSLESKATRAQRKAAKQEAPIDMAEVYGGATNSPYADWSAFSADVSSYQGIQQQLKNQ